MTSLVKGKAGMCVQDCGAHATWPLSGNPWQPGNCFDWRKSLFHSLTLKKGEKTAQACANGWLRQLTNAPSETLIHGHRCSCDSIFAWSVRPKAKNSSQSPSDPPSTATSSYGCEEPTFSTDPPRAHPDHSLGSKKRRLSVRFGRALKLPLTLTEKL